MLTQHLSGPPWASPTGYVAARQHRDNRSFTRVDTCKLFYMDVGVWGGGPDGQAKTTFGLVCGNDVLLCSWLNLVEGGQAPWPHYVQLAPEGTFDLSNGARKFFESAHELHRGFVVYNARSDEPLTDPGQPVIVIPDLHLHLYKGELIDRFQHQPTSPVAAGKFAHAASAAGLRERRDVLKQYYVKPPAQPLVSLDEELANMIDIAKHCSADIVQLGDLYEVWEAEVLLRMQYLEMLNAEADLSSRYGVSLRTDEKRMLTTKKVLPRDLQCPFDRYAAYMRELPDPIIDLYGVDFIHTVDICDAIRKTHPILFQGGDGSNLFKYLVDGNHDNQQKNLYWIYYATDAYRNSEVLGGGTISGKRHLDVVNEQIGTGDHLIHIEHGHRYDWHNNNDNWWKEGAGFDTVFDFLLGTKGFLAGLREGSLGGTLGTGGQEGRKFADRWAENHAYDMRKPGCRAADEAFGTSPSKA